MKYFFKNIGKICLIAICGITFLASCNKDIEQPTPIIFSQNAGTTQTISDFLNAEADYTFLLAALKKAAPAGGTAGALLASLADKNNSFTLFAPNNNAFIASSIPSIAAINSSAFRAGQLDSLLRYHIIPGRQYLSADIPTTFPNIELPSGLSVGILPGTIVPFNLRLYPSRRTTGFWANNIPVVSADKIFLNGVLHTTATLVSPPSQFLAASSPIPSVIYSDPQLTMFDSLIARGDQAQTNPALKVDSIFKNAGANLTVFAPTNTAVKAFINTASSEAVPLAAPDAVFFGFIRTSLPATSAQGIVLYHILGVRAFSVNFPSTATNFPTLLNGGVPTHPGVSVQSFFRTGGLAVDSIKVLGAANRGLFATSKPPSNFDKNAVNGVVHIIDRVLLPF
jgi:uncharacterized surface protein with fasciclin (FAS1) repeats